MPEKEHKDVVKAYFATKESRLGYKYLLKGTKHYGYYPSRRNDISMAEAQLEMERQLGKALNLLPGSKVLDAGCGEGLVAIHLNKEFGYEIFGVDILDWSIDNANKNKQRADANGLQFQVSDYSHTDFPDNYFDGVYTMETLVHSGDYKKALKEFYRVLKPGGILVNFEYALDDELHDETEKWQTIYQGGALIKTFYDFRVSRMEGIWQNAGFKKVTVTDITKYMVPFMKRLYQLAIIPYGLMKMTKQEKKHVNAYAAVISYPRHHQFHYTIMRGYKPGKLSHAK